MSNGQDNTVHKYPTGDRTQCRVIEYPKHPRGVRVQASFCHQGLHTCFSFIVGIDGDERFRPKTAARIKRINLGPNVPGTDLSERSRKTLVVIYESAV